MPNSLEILKSYTTVVADTGDFNSIAAYNPQDATTNPSLILAATNDKTYGVLLTEAAKHSSDLTKNVNFLLCSFGRKILDIVPGRVSTEVDARLSFDTNATVARALELIAVYKSMGIDKKRILVKIASTWEGIKAAEILERDHGVFCNLTLLFSFAQAVACAEAKVSLISPFVGRILDWFKKANPSVNYSPEQDPGVVSVRAIYNYYKKFGYDTVIMGASFRSVDQIIQLAGCDLLTISPKLLEELNKMQKEFPAALQASQAMNLDIQKVTFNEKDFRWALNQDQMATEKLSEGIRKFSEDCVTLEELVVKQMKSVS